MMGNGFKFTLEYFCQGIPWPIHCFAFYICWWVHHFVIQLDSPSFSPYHVQHSYRIQIFEGLPGLLLFQLEVTHPSRPRFAENLSVSSFGVLLIFKFIFYICGYAANNHVYSTKKDYLAVLTLTYAW